MSNDSSYLVAQLRKLHAEITASDGHECDMMSLVRRAADALEGIPETTHDPNCICHGNWRAIVKEYEPLIGTRFRDQQGREFTLFGIVLTDEDYYYGMSSKMDGMRLLTCVGYLDERGHGFTSIDGPRPEGQSSLRYSQRKTSGDSNE